MPSSSCRITMMVAAVMLAGCGWFGDDSEVEQQAVQDQAIVGVRKVPVQSVERIEVGRTRNGILISAFGTAQGLGYALPALRARRSGAPGRDGFMEFDFVATEPSPELRLPAGTTRTRALRADRPINEVDLRGILGIRVYALNGAVQASFGAAEPE